MKRAKSAVVLGVLAVLSLSIPFASAQKASLISQPRTSAYIRSREVSFQGTVLSFETRSASAPFGPHAVIQTSSGTVDVHLGDARLVQSSGLNLAPGDSIRVVGASAGTTLLARIVQKGNLTVAVRTPRGVVLRPGRPAVASDAAKTNPGGVL